MAFQTQDGQRAYGSKFRSSRYDRENSNPDAGNRAKAHELTGLGGKPSPDTRLNSNPHSEKFNTPLSGPHATSDMQESGAAQAEAQEMHSVQCPHCGGEVPVTGDTNHSDDMGPMSEDEQAVHAGKKAKGAWGPGQREQPDAQQHDDYDVEPL